MKYKYIAEIPTVLLVGDDLLTIRKGDIVDLFPVPSADFVLVEKKKVSKGSPVTTKRKINNASSA